MTNSDTDRDAQHVLNLIRANGWRVYVLPQSGKCVMTASGGLRSKGGRGICSAEAATLYLAACELAEQCGIDLRDG